MTRPRKKAREVWARLGSEESELSRGPEPELVVRLPLLRLWGRQLPLPFRRLRNHTVRPPGDENIVAWLDCLISRVIILQKCEDTELKICYTRGSQTTYMY